MILKMKMKDDSRKNIEIIKKQLFQDTDKITAGYIIGLAVERTTSISNDEWKATVNNVLYGSEPSKSKSTSVSLRQEIYEKINQIKENLEKITNRSLYTSQVIDVILSIVASRICNSMPADPLSLVALEWNLNARTGFIGYVIPVTLIANEIFEKNPHIFILTEFVKATGWLDLKSILEEKYYISEKPFLSHQNGICIGIRKGCGIEFLGAETENLTPPLNSPDFYEVKIRANSQTISVIGTRIKIDCRKANSKNRKERISEHRQRFEQYTSLIKHVAQLENVIALADFNNSRIQADENETNEMIINDIYNEKDSIEYNFQKMRAFLSKMTDGKFSLYTADGDKSSVGAFWDNTKKKATPPPQNKFSKHKYDHILTNFCLQNAEYDWSFLKFYNSEQFTSNGKIIAGIPDHAILLAEIKLSKNQSN